MDWSAELECHNYKMHSNPRNVLECYLECVTPHSKNKFGLECGLHSKNYCGTGVWIALQKNRSAQYPGFWITFKEPE